jgi:prefoldin subunit 5
MARIWEPPLTTDNRDPAEALKCLEMQAEFFREEIERLKNEINKLEKSLNVRRGVN